MIQISISSLITLSCVYTFSTVDNIPLLQVHVFNTHLSLSHKARATSVLQAWGSMNTFSGPAFLMGDFNAEAHNVEVQYVNIYNSIFRVVKITRLQLLVSAAS